MNGSVRLIADVQATLGEGPVWVAREQALYWLDIKGRRILRVDAEHRLTEWATPFRICSLAPRTAGGFVGGTERGFAYIDPEAGTYDVFVRPEEEAAGNRFNDGKMDRQGRFWAGTMDDAEQADSGNLYRLGPDRTPVLQDSGYRVTNGPAFSPDGRTMYHNDSARQITYAFDLDEAGAATNRRTFLTFEPEQGYPDGMTVDAEACLWIAFWDGGCLRRYAPNGELIGQFDVPVSRPTSCAFGGADLDRLYITSARIGLDERELAMQPSAGGLFMLETGVRGLQEAVFAA